MRFGLPFVLFVACVSGTATVENPSDPTPGTTEPSSEICGTGDDEDGDGLTDCLDDDCAGSCPTGGTLLSSIPPELYESACESVAAARTERVATCEGASFTVEGRTVEQSQVDCTSLLTGSGLVGCGADWNDLLTYLSLPDSAACDTGNGDFQSVQSALECLPLAPPVFERICPTPIDQRPVDGAIGVSYHDDLYFQLSENDSSASVSVLAPSGDLVSGTTTAQGDWLVFTPNEPFAPSTTFEPTLSYCGATLTRTTSFTTGSITEPPTSLAGSAFSIDFESGVFVRPPGVGPLLAPLLADRPLLLGLTSLSDEGMTFDLGIGETATTQDLCVETQTFASTFVDGAYFEASGNIALADGIALEGARLSGLLDSTGPAIRGLSVEAAIDTRDLVPLISPGGAPDSVCTLLTTLGNSCEMCPDGSGTFCLSLIYVDSVAAEIPGLTVAEVLDPTCP